MTQKHDLLMVIKSNVVKGKPSKESRYPRKMQGEPGVKEFVEKALNEGIEASEILNTALIPGMDVVGEKFSNGEYFVPEMLQSAQAMKAGVKVLEPHLTEETSRKTGTVILGTVKGDLHDIGKNLVSIMLEGAGFEVIDLGTDTAPRQFASVAQEHPNAVIGMSALLTTTREMMQKTIESMRERGIENKVIIGGAATSQTFADEIQADAYTRDAAKASPLIKKLMGIPN